MDDVKRFRTNEELTPKRLNEVVDALNQARKWTACFPLKLDRGAEGFQISLMDLIGLRFAYAPSTGTPAIPAAASGVPGTATVYLADWDGTTLAAGSRTETVHNPWSTTVSTNKLILMMMFMETWWLIGSDC